MWSGVPPIATYAVLGLTLWVTWRALHDHAVFERLLFRPGRVWPGREWYRLLTSGLVHVDWLHFWFNAITVLAFGEPLERSLGANMFLLIYLGAIAGGGVLSWLFHRHHADYSAAGASGGACGLVFAHIFLFPGSQLSLLLLPVYVPAWIFAALFLLWTFSGITRGADNIGHDAHLGGALVGMIIAVIYAPTIVWLSRWLFLGVLGATLFFFLALTRHPTSSLRTLFAPGVRSHRAAQRYQRYDEAFDRVSMKRRLDQLLDKISREGFPSLTPAERREMDELAKKLKR